MDSRHVFKLPRACLALTSEAFDGIGSEFRRWRDVVFSGLKLDERE